MLDNKRICWKSLLTAFFDSQSTIYKLEPALTASQQPIVYVSFQLCINDIMLVAEN